MTAHLYHLDPGPVASPFAADRRRADHLAAQTATITADLARVLAAAVATVAQDAGEGA